jgi:predicted alpha-1,2-mannosidase
MTRRGGACGPRLPGAFFAVLVLAAAHASEDPIRYVDPFVGTGGHGHTYPGATLPFGMVQLSPDTRLEGWDGCSGYHYSDSVVYGFSHTHLSGTGVSDYGDILFMPITGEPKLDNGYGAGPDAGYASRFDKTGERAEAGWYAVDLADYGIAVELTATERAGLHRYRFPSGAAAHVIVDLEHRDTVVDASLRVVGDHEIEGFRRSTGWARDQIVYFVARFSRPFAESRLARGELLQPDIRELSGKRVKGVFSFGDEGGELLVKVGISAVDVDGARRNLDAELPGWDFDAVRRAARERWNDALGRIEVEGGTEEQRRVFYSALYHSLIAPNLFSDVDGRYRGIDRRVHRAEDRRHYPVFSLWDTFRTTHPLYTLI